MRARRIGRLAAGALASALALVPAFAEGTPVGPCSPYRAADGDVPSEMPGCARHRRPVPGSLDDEIEFARRPHVGADPASDDLEGGAPSPRHRPRRRRE